MKHSGGHNLCNPGLRDFGTINGSSIILSDLGNKDTSFYWCEDKDGRMSEYTAIRIEGTEAHSVFFGHCPCVSVCVSF